MQISERVDKVLRRQLGPHFQWDRHTMLREKPGLELDSIDIVELVMGLEEEFGVAINDSDFEVGVGGIETVGDVADYMAGHVETKQAMFG